MKLKKALAGKTHVLKPETFRPHPSPEGLGSENAVRQIIEAFIVAHPPKLLTLPQLAGMAVWIHELGKASGHMAPAEHALKMLQEDMSLCLEIVSAADPVTASYRHEVFELRTMVRHMTQNHFKLIETHEKLVNEDHKRQLELRRAHFEEVRQEKIFDQIALVLPIVLRMFAENKTISRPLKELTTDVLESLSDKEVLDFIQRLDPAHQNQFLNLYRNLRDSRAKKRKAK